MAKPFYILLYFILLVVSCKTVGNGYSKMPIERYDIRAIEKFKILNSYPTDTIIFLKIDCSGMCTRGIENNLFIFNKKGDKTQIERISNLRKYQIVTLTASRIKWKTILDNIQIYKSDKIIDYKEVIKNNQTLQIHALSDGQTQSLAIKYDKIYHRVFLAPNVNSYNENNINVLLINDLTALVTEINWFPAEKIKYKKSR